MKFTPELASRCPQSEIPAKLKGSIKQVNWANELRTNMLSKLAIEGTSEDGAFGDGWADKETIYRCVLACEDASWFISSTVVENNKRVIRPWWDIDWDWLSKTDEERAKIKAGPAATAKPAPACSIGRAEEIVVVERADRDRYTKPTQAFLLSVRVKTAKGALLKNVLTTLNPVDWLIQKRQESANATAAEDVALVGAWEITPEQYQKLLRVI